MGDETQPFCLRDETCVVVATGPSAGAADFGILRQFSTIAVNDAYKLCPWADILYACDPEWWEAHIADARQTFAGKLWTQDDRAAKKHRLYRIAGAANVGLSRTPGVIHFNSNSGAQAINIATLAGAKTLILVGFDMKGPASHFFGQHPPNLRKSSDYADWVRKFAAIAADLKAMGVRVINTSADSALPYFEKVPCQQLTAYLESSRSTAGTPSRRGLGLAGTASSTAGAIGTAPAMS